MTAKDLFIQFFKSKGYTYLIGVFILIIINLLMLQLPKIIGQAVDTLSHNKDGLLSYLGILFILMLIVTVLKSISRNMLLGSIRKMEYIFRKNLCDHALSISTAYYEKNGPGKVMALMTNDVTSLRVSLGLGMMIIVDAIFFGIFSFYYLVQHVSIILAVQIMSPMPFILIGMLVLSRSMRKKQRSAQDTYSHLTEFSQELFLGINIIKAFNKEGMGINRFKSINEENFNKNMNVSFLDAILKPLTYIAPLTCLCISIYLCGKLVASDQITAGNFVSINAYIMLLIAPLMSLGSLLSVMQKGLASYDRISNFLAIPKELICGQNEPMIPVDDLHIDNLTFTYEGSQKPALKNISLHIPKGALIGLVGAPGSGKTTLFKLLTRIQEVPRGTIRLGDKDINDIPLGLLRKSIAYVSQESNVLSTSIKSNIIFGQPNTNHIPFKEAAARADLYRDLSKRLEEETDVSLHEGGNNLSGGQKQRISLARAFYKNASYLLLDDSFSALDPLSAKHIVESLRGQINQTILFISQRLEAIRQADCIYVFKDGQIIESGSHQELMDLGGEYYTLYFKQEKRKSDDR